MRVHYILSCCVLFVAACGGPADIGGSCDPAADGSCIEGLVCAADAEGANVCQIPLGGECDVMRDPTGCLLGSECIEVTEVVDGEETMVGRCFIPEGGACDPTTDEDYCDPSLTCAPLTDGTYACHRPFFFRGRVSDSTTDAPIEGAHVLALDVQPIAVTDIAVSDVDGNYELEVPVVRETDGTPVAATYTLRASADGYQTFPGGIRTAIPISTTLVTETEEAWVVMGTLTDIVLVPVEDPTAPRASISGHVLAEDGQEAGVLVVATPSGLSAVSDVTGAYTIFNVPPGAYEVRGYAAGLQLVPANVTVADADLTDVDLAVSDAALSEVSGTMQIVNPGDCTATSVILVVESTFDETLGRGEVPPGLRAPPGGEAPSITNGQTWTIPDVPDGRYVVLAAFENDSCVRDPDTSIAGTLPVHIGIPEEAGAIPESFKVTGALAVFGPGVDEPEGVSAPPTLSWEDDSSERDYLVEVFDAYGNLAWMTTVDGVSGSSMVSVDYAGPFEPGMYYQFRATSRDGTMTPLSRTEDLRGVFFAQ